MTYKVSVVQRSKVGVVTVTPVASVDADEFVVGASEEKPLFGHHSGGVSFYVIQERTLRAPVRSLVAYFPAGSEWVIEQA